MTRKQMDSSVSRLELSYVSAACRRIVFPFSQPAPLQPQSACRTGSEPVLHPVFVLVSFQVECVSLLEALIQSLLSNPRSELFNQIEEEHV
ncbi:hypothetical protein PAMA_015561 [Pampus argenteus]